MKRMDLVVKVVVEDKDFDKLQEIVKNKYAEGDDSLERLITEGLFENHLNCVSVKVEQTSSQEDNFPDLTTDSSQDGWGEDMEAWYAAADRFLTREKEGECAPF